MIKSAKQKWVYLLIAMIAVGYSLWKARLGLHWDELTAIEEGIMIQKGARFISEDWAPLQLTAMVLAPLAALWKTWFGSYSGIILALRYLYFFLQLAIAVYLYHSLRSEYGKKCAYVVSMMHYLYFYSWTTINYKSMFYMGGIITIISIYNYCKGKKTGYLLLASIASMYMIVGYPHGIVICAAFCLAIWKLAGAEKKKALSVYVACCLVLGIGLLLYLVVQCGGVQQLLLGVSGILSDEYHTEGLWSKAARLIGPIIILFLLEGAAAYCVEKFVFTKGKLGAYKGVLWAGAFVVGVTAICLARIKSAGPSRFWYIFLVLFLLTPHFLGKDFLRRNRKEVYLFIVPTIFMMFAIVLATNQGIAIVAYGTIWGLMGLALAIYSSASAYKPVVAYLVAALSFVFVIFVPDMEGGGTNIFQHREKITVGSAKGIYADANTKARYDLICDVVSRYVDADDQLLIVADPLMAAGYMYTDAIEATFAPDYVAASTSRYVSFYEKQPHRAPNVIILDEEFINLYAEDMDAYLANSPLGKYIIANFKQENKVVDGKYVIYYAEDGRI